MDRSADVRYFASERNKRGMTMRCSAALVLLSIPFAIACATTEPLDLSELQLLYDAGPSMDAGAATQNGGFPAELGGSANGGFVAAGGFTSSATGGTSSRFPPIGTGGRAGRGNGDATGGAATGRGGSVSSTGGAPSAPPAGAGGASCRANEKVCGGVCVSPAPRTGCGSTGCAPCTNTAPSNGVVICNSSQQCDFDCLSGYTKTGSSCVAPAGSGGSTGGGGGGTPGPAVSCGGTTCPSCSVILGPACCNGNKCGCPLIPWTAGFLGCI